MYNTPQGVQGIPNKSNSERKYNNFYYSSPKTATSPGVPSSESHDLDLLDATSTAGPGVLSQMTGYNPLSDRIIGLNAQTPETRSWRQVC